MPPGEPGEQGAALAASLYYKRVVLSSSLPPKSQTFLTSILPVFHCTVATIVAELGEFDVLVTPRSEMGQGFALVASDASKEVYALEDLLPAVLEWTRQSQLRRGRRTGADPPVASLFLAAAFDRPLHSSRRKGSSSKPVRSVVCKLCDVEMEMGSDRANGHVLSYHLHSSLDRMTAKERSLAENEQFRRMRAQVGQNAAVLHPTAEVASLGPQASPMGFWEGSRMFKEQPGLHSLYPPRPKY